MSDDWIDVPDKTKVRDLVTRHFPSEAVSTALNIMQAESSGNVGATNANRNGTKDRGLFQINDTNVPALRKAGIIKTASDLYDPEINVKAAAYLHEQQGTKPWNSSKATWGKKEADEWVDTGNDWTDIKPTIKRKPSLEDTVPKWGREHPNLYGVAGAAYETLSPLLEAGGLAGGALYGGVPGAALGYGAAKRISQAAGQALGVREQETPLDAITATGRDIKTGAEMEMGGQVAGKILPTILGKTDEAKMYERVMKPSTALKEAERIKRIDTALREKLPLSKKAVEKSKETISNINKEIQSRIDAHATAGATVNPESVATRAESTMMNKITGKEAFPIMPTKQVQELTTEFKEAHPDIISVREAQNYKQSINKQLDDFYKNLQASPDKTTWLQTQWTQKTKAAIADQLRGDIEQIFPEVKALNKREASLIQLNKSLERAVNRISNHEILSLKGVISMVKDPKWFITNYILNNPTVQSNLAIAIRQAKLAGYGTRPTLTEAATKAIATKVKHKPKDYEYTDAGELRELAQ